MYQKLVKSVQQSKIIKEGQRVLTINLNNKDINIEMDPIRMRQLQSIRSVFFLYPIQMCFKPVPQYCVAVKRMK